MVRYLKKTSTIFNMQFFTKAQYTQTVKQKHTGQKVIFKVLQTSDMDETKINHGHI